MEASATTVHALMSSQTLTVVFQSPVLLLDFPLETH